jgi:ABC-2 type transport system ATP-binding protein
MTGLSKPSSGNIYYKDKKNFNNTLGYVPQNNALYENLSGYDNLSFYYDMLGIKGDRTKRISEIGEYLNIEKDLKKKVSQYSGGMKRKLDIGAALLNNPEILIMDEPTAGLDILTRNSIINLLKKINSEGKTIVFTSHYISEMEEICHKIIFLKDKKIAFSGIKEDLIKYYKEFNRLEDLYIHLYNE